MSIYKKTFKKIGEVNFEMLIKDFEKGMLDFICDKKSEEDAPKRE